ncbi:hypothetical protein FRD01_13675 [Microvenator marinus]|uniref:Uncharacterized protein n=1 Tax=Microvenator marinus TaxID=2600177 RepID=A0A5B8XRI1_9DELT|nr:hypothetical protein [Microvenator marinus]QED28260.1 hypothetical protein FRD01_13675 [Microvenator marinus]
MNTRKQLLTRAMAVHLETLAQAEKFGVDASSYDVTKLLHTSESGKTLVLIEATERLSRKIAQRRRYISNSKK